jgi:hypothetical protein
MSRLRQLPMRPRRPKAEARAARPSGNRRAAGPSRCRARRQAGVDARRTALPRPIAHGLGRVPAVRARLVVRGAVSAGVIVETRDGNVSARPVRHPHGERVRRNHHRRSGAAVSARGLQSARACASRSRSGLQQKNDPRALQLPGADRCKDVAVRRDRRPAASATRTRRSGRAALERAPRRLQRRRVASRSPRPACTRGPTLGTWVSKGTHLAVKVDEDAHVHVAGRSG